MNLHQTDQIPTDALPAWQAFWQAIGRHGTAQAIVTYDGTTCDYAAVATLRHKWQGVLADHDIAPGSRVATVLGNGAFAGIAQLSLLDRVNVIPFGLADNVHRLARQIRPVDADYLLIAKDVPQATQDVLQSAFAGRTIICDPKAPSDTNPDLPDLPPTVQTGLVLLTSGSTGTPKRVPLSPAQLLASAQNISAHLRLTNADRALHTLPMFHIGALVDLLIAPLLAGGSVHFVDGMDPASIIRALRDQSPTWMQLVPTALNALLQDLETSQAGDLGAKLRFMRLVSADVSADLLARARIQFPGVSIVQMYGMTETAGQITSMPVDNDGTIQKSVGQAAGAQIAILDATGNACRPDETGEVCVRGRSVTKGYEGDQPTPRHGDWLRTGDLGYLDVEGYLYLTGRLKELINRGGEKISPLIVERAAKSHPAVSEAVAFAEPHPSLGEHVALAVVLRDPADAADVLAQMKTRLNEAEMPRNLRVVDAFPRLPGGKIDRKAVAAMGTASDTPISPRRSGLAATVSDLWQGQLRCRAPLDHSDFFEDGGDSLLATEFIMALEKALGHPIDSNILFQAPTFSALVAALKQPSQAIGGTQTKEPRHIRYIRQQTAGWQGKRAGPQGLLIARRTHLDTTKVFFAASALLIPDPLTNRILKSHPAYIMRSLMFYKGRSADLTRALADTYCAEISSVLAPREEIILGGFCEGADLGQLLADRLMARGHRVRLFICVDQVIATPTPYPVFYLWSKRSNYSGNRRYIDPTRGFGLLHPSGADAMILQRRHLKLLDEKTIPKVARRLRPYALGQPLPQWSHGEQLTLQARQRRHVAKVTLKAPMLLSRKSPAKITVTVTNQSDQTWPATAESGLFLSIDFLARRTNTQALRYAQQTLDAPVSPGETVTFDVTIRWPNARWRPYRLAARMVDDGLGPFEATGAASKWVLRRII